MLVATDQFEPPNARVQYKAVSVGDSLYVWAGYQDGLPSVHDSEEKRKFTSNIQHFTPSTGQWVSRATTGTPPLGVRGYSCTAIVINCIILEELVVMTVVFTTVLHNWILLVFDGES